MTMLTDEYMENLAASRQKDGEKPVSCLFDNAITEDAALKPTASLPIDLGKPLRHKLTKQSARLVCVDSFSCQYVVAIQAADDEREWLKFGNEIFKNLENVPEKRKGWINLYKSAFNNHVAAVSHAYDTKAVADANKDKLGERIACIEIEWTE